MGTLKIVATKSGTETYFVRIEDSKVYVSDLTKDSKNVLVSEMEEIFPNFAKTISGASETYDLLSKLQVTNYDYVWAHVSGKL